MCPLILRTSSIETVKGLCIRNRTAEILHLFTVILASSFLRVSLLPLAFSISEWREMGVRWFMFLRNYVNVLARRSLLLRSISYRPAVSCGLSASLPIADIIERNLRDRRVNDREIGGDQRDREGDSRR